jgi:cobalt/nickel transport system permease protein
MHHAVVDGWSRGGSALHRWDARLKFVALIVLLVALGLQRTPGRALVLMIPLLAAVICSGLPVGGVMGRAAMVLPLSGTFAIIAWWMGDGARAGLLLTKGFLSAWAAMLLIATTPMPRLMAALHGLGVPRLLVLTIQMVYRYLFVVFETAQSMRHAAMSRAGLRPSRRLLWRSGGGLMAVLFAGAHGQAEGIHRAMLARGFTGEFPLLAPGRAQEKDWWMLAAAVGSAGLPFLV